MFSFKLDQKFEAVDDWGVPEDAGAETLEGAPMKVGGKIMFGSLDGPVQGGLYQAAKGRFRVTYPYHEHSTIREGLIEVTDETTGTTISYGPGDSWIIAMGAQIIWDVKSDTALVSFLGTTTKLA